MLLQPTRGSSPVQGHALLWVWRQEVSLWPPGSHEPSRTGKHTQIVAVHPSAFRDVGAKEVLREGKETAHAGQQHQAPVQGTPRSAH